MVSFARNLSLSEISFEDGIIAIHFLYSDYSIEIIGGNQLKMMGSGEKCGTLDLSDHRLLDIDLSTNKICIRTDHNKFEFTATYEPWCRAPKDYR